MPADRLINEIVSGICQLFSLAQRKEADARPVGRCEMRSSRIIKDYTMTVADKQ